MACWTFSILIAVTVASVGAQPDPVQDFRRWRNEHRAVPINAHTKATGSSAQLMRRSAASPGSPAAAALATEDLIIHEAEHDPDKKTRNFNAPQEHKDGRSRRDARPLRDVSGEGTEERDQDQTKETAVTESPVTEAPVTEAPVVEAAVTEAPVTEAPVTEAPVVEAAVTEAPVAEAPVTDAPVVEAAVTEAPVTEVTEAPAVHTKEEQAPEQQAPEVEEEPSETYTEGGCEFSPWTNWHDDECTAVDPDTSSVRACGNFKKSRHQVKMCKPDNIQTTEYEYEPCKTADGEPFKACNAGHISGLKDQLYNDWKQHQEENAATLLLLKELKKKQEDIGGDFGKFHTPQAEFTGGLEALIAKLKTHKSGATENAAHWLSKIESHPYHKTNGDVVEEAGGEPRLVEKGTHGVREEEVEHASTDEDDEEGNGDGDGEDTPRKMHS